jgi:ABC-type enterobactin transport system permease subunit
MKLGSILGILLLATAIVYGEWRSCKEKRARIVTAGITVVAAVIGIILLFQPRLPGPTQIVKLVFGSVDKFMK